MNGAESQSPKFSLDTSSGEPEGAESPDQIVGTLLPPGLEKIRPPEPPRGAPPVPGGPPSRKYAYRSPWVRRVFRLLDGAGGRLIRRKRKRPETLRRVLVLRPDHLGDVLFSFPALGALREKLPEARIDVLVGPGSRQLFPGHPKDFHGIEILEFSAPWLARPKRVRFGMRGVLGLARMLRRRARALGGPYDLAIDLRGDFQLILAARLAGVRYLAGRGHTGLGFLLDAEEGEIDGRHQVENNLALLESAGFGPLDTGNLRLEISGEELEAGRALLEENGVSGSKIVIGIHPGAGQATKRWGIDKYSHLIKRIISDLPAQVVLLGGPEDRPVVDDLLIALKGTRTAGRVVDLCGNLTGLRAFMGVVRHCNLFIGNDSGPGHIAAALGVPLICLFSGTNDPAEWGPRGPSVVIIRKRIECEGCGLTVCDHHSCMVDLDAGHVYQAVRRCV